MGKEKLEPRLEDLKIESMEQLQAMGNPVHRRIFRILEEKGPCCLADFTRLMDYAESTMEEYLHGLVSVGLLDEVQQEDRTYYLPAAKYFTVSPEVFRDKDGIESVRELLLDRLAELAQAVVRLDDDYVDRGRITFNHYNFTEEDVTWARKRISEMVRELSDRSKKVATEETKPFQFNLFFYPLDPEN